ncbi:MAG: ABC transporter ATP-binding protein/permease [Defluviitaleaceae bacterium]|nr:ABC transporter ATP-binding protein/permease [Defluviitaleaceae bacterium]
MKKMLANNWFLFKICLTAAPGYVLAYAFDIFRKELGIFLGFTVFFQYALNAAEFGLPFINVAILFGVFCLYEVIHLFFDSARQKKLAPKALPVMRRRLKGLLFEKAREIDLDAYDNPQFYNDYIMAINESDNQIDKILMTMEHFVGAATRVVLAGGFFIFVDPISFIFVFASFGLQFLLETAVNKLNFKIRMQKNPIERKFQYINRVFYLPDYAKELRLNPEAADRLQREHTQINNELQTIDETYAKKLTVLGWLRRYVVGNFIFNALYMAYLVLSAAVLGRISMGNVVIFHGTARRLSYGMTDMSRTFTDIADISRYVERINIFLEKKPQIVSEKNLPVPKENAAEIELKNVSFRYSENTPYALNNVSLKIKSGEKAAIVGYNGAGKSTLVKLVMRLYDPTEGEILLNGTNIKDYNLEEYRRAVGVIFQDYKIFAATVRENILLDIADEAHADVTPALQQAGFTEKLASLPLGTEQPLTTEFAENGVNLSGGEAQKLAIARAFHKHSPLIILDEPSSALDPIAEYHFNHAVAASSMRSGLGGTASESVLSGVLAATDEADFELTRHTTADSEKTMVFISHRLSTTRIADTIFLMENGQLAEQGNHSELLTQNGKYAEMWNAQTSRYLK